MFFNRRLAFPLLVPVCGILLVSCLGSSTTASAPETIPPQVGQTTDPDELALVSADQIVGAAAESMAAPTVPNRLLIECPPKPKNVDPNLAPRYVRITTDATVPEAPEAGAFRSVVNRDNLTRDAYLTIDDYGQVTNFRRVGGRIFAQQQSGFWIEGKSSSAPDSFNDVSTDDLTFVGKAEWNGAGVCQYRQQPTKYFFGNELGRISGDRYFDDMGIEVYSSFEFVMKTNGAKIVGSTSTQILEPFVVEQPD